MNAQSKIEPATLEALRLPFADHHISKLPKPTKAQTEAVRADFKKGIRCKECGSWHHPEVIHLDYVGHAALTDRLLDVDLLWSWEPLAYTELGLPAFDQTGGLWIKLTVLGVTRLGYGHAAAKPNSDPGAREKEVIGDALRNAAMRFGAALDLWHKGDLHAGEESASGGGEGQSQSGAVDPPAPEKRVKLDGPYTSKTALWAAFKAFDRELRGCGDSDEFELLLLTKEATDLIAQCERDAPQLLEGGPDMPDEFVPLLALIEQRRAEFKREPSPADMIRAG